MRIDQLTLWQIMHRSYARYLTLTPQGLRFPDGIIRSNVMARIIHTHPTRTLYKDRKPICRSLDGFKPLHQKLAQHCADCRARQACTAQLNLQLAVDDVPYNILLSFSSLKNFVGFKSRFNRPLDRVEVLLKVRDRGHWGELTFAANPSATQATTDTSPRPPDNESA